MYIYCIYMKTKVKKWGNSYAIRIPKKIMEDLMIVEDSELQIYSKDFKLILEKENKEQILEKLLKGIQKQQEVDWGKTNGKEFW